MPILPICFATGLIAGIIDAIAGGGGLISLPMLLSLGIPPQLALGTNKLQGMFGTGVAAFSYYRHGLLNRQGLVRGLVSCSLGAILGAIATQLVSNEFLKHVIPFLLFLVFTYVVFCPRLGVHDESPKWRFELFYPVVGLALGVYDGFLGPGVGGFWVFLLMYFLGYNILKATAHAKLFNFTTNVVAVLCFAIGGNIDYRLGLCMAAGQMIGGRIGALFALSRGVKLVRPLFLVMMFSSIVTLIYRDESDWSGALQWGFALVFMVIAVLYFWKRSRDALS